MVSSHTVPCRSNKLYKNEYTPKIYIPTVFQCVPVFIPKSFFVSLDSIISSYIWQNKKPWICKTLLRRLKIYGGMGLPDIRHYYWATNIHFLAFWNHFYLQPNSPEWTTLELRSCQNISLPALLGSPLRYSTTKPIDNPVVCHTLRVWAQFRRTFGYSDLFLFIPSLHDLTFQDGHKKGIRWFKDMFEDKCFMSFNQLSEKYDLPKTHFFQYLQVRHYVSSILPCFPKEPDSNPTDTFLSFDPLSKDAMPALYRKISMLTCPPLDRIKIAWENDLGCTLLSSHQYTNPHYVQDTALCN